MENILCCNWFYRFKKLIKQESFLLFFISKECFKSSDYAWYLQLGEQPNE